MRRLFDALEDEAPPSTGAEIGAALAPALAEIAAAGERQAQMLAQAITSALREAGQQQTPQQAQPQPVTSWVFDVIRDDDGNMVRVTARAGVEVA